MVHPGFVVAGVVGTVVTGVVIYAIVKEVLESPMVPVGWFERPGRQRGRQQSQQRQRQQQQQYDQDEDYDRGQSSSVNEGEYELRRRRRRPSEDELTEEKTSDNDELLERLRKVEESERANAAQAARLKAMERSLLQLQENLERSMHEQDELRKSIVLNARHEQEIDQNQHPFRSYSPEYYPNPFAGSQPSIHDYDHNETHHRPASSSSSRISSRPANAILGHNLSNDYQENVNPFADPSLLENGSASSVRSSFHADNFGDAFTDADDRSVTIGNDDEHDWTEAEIGSMGSHDSDESWVSN